MTQRGTWTRWVVRGLAVALLVGVSTGDAAAGVHLRQQLTPTIANPSAQGRAVIVVAGVGRATRGKLKLSVRNLAPASTFSVRIAGVPIGSLTTNSAGRGRARFSTAPGPADQLLGVDPRGQTVEVADDQGEDELDGDMPDDSPEPCCCIEDDQGENEGEEMDPSECPGTVPGAPSCLPDPCNDDGAPIVCCIPDSDGPECEQTSAAECGNESGVNLGAGSCDPNPCAPPPPPGVAPCCIPDDDGTGSECEILTSDHCDEEQGTTAPAGATSCEPNPCP